MLPAMTFVGSPAMHLLLAEKKFDEGDILKERPHHGAHTLRVCKNWETIPGPIKQEYYTKYKFLDQKTLKSFLNADIGSLKKQSRVWICAETALLLSFPEITPEVEKFIHSWWAQLTRIVIKEKRTVPATKFWKSYTLQIRGYFLGLENMRSDFSPFPPFPKGSWMEKKPGTLTRSEYALVHAMSQSRHFPPGDKVQERESLEKYHEVLTKPSDPISDAERMKLERYATTAGVEVRRCVPEYFFKRNTGHLSISNSSCIEMTRSEGGKRSYLLPKLNSWLFEEVQESRIIDSLGREWKFPNGPRWKAFSDVEHFGKRKPNFIQNEIEGFEEQTLANALFVMCESELKELGIIDEKCNATLLPYTTKNSAVREPGAKIRIVTKANAALVTYLQPAAHILKELLSFDPTLRAGLQGGYQGFEWLKRVSRNPPKGEALLLGDFEQATDLLCRHRAYIILTNFLEGFGMNSKYINTCLEIILGNYLVDDFFAVRGCPMGMPCTKPILHIMVKTISLMSKGVEIPRTAIQLESDPFSAAGDDLIDICSVETARRYKRMVIKAGLKPSEDKWGIYKYGGPYCEQMLLHDNVSYAFPPDQNNSVLLDSLRLRLLSRETKPTQGDEDRNPIFGKAKLFQKELDWTPEFYTGYKARARQLFLRNFKPLIRLEGVTPYNLFLPSSLGGLGLKPVSEDEWDFLTEEIPDWHLNSIKMMSSCDDRTYTLLYKAMSEWSSPFLGKRGFDSQVDDYKTDLFGLLTMYLPWYDFDSAYSLAAEEKKADIQPMMRYAQKKDVIEKSGYINLISALNRLEPIPFWDIETKTNRGWPKRTFAKRTEILKENLPLISEPRPSKEEIKNILSKVYWPKAVYVAKEDLLIHNMDNGQIESLGLLSSSLGASVHLNMSNEQILGKKIVILKDAT